MIQAEKNDVSLVLRINGRVDAENADTLERECDRWITQGEKTLVLDFSGVTYISSAGLRSVLIAGKKLRAGNGKLIVCGLQGTVKDVFSFSGFDSVFPIFNALEDVQASLRKTP